MSVSKTNPGPLGLCGFALTTWLLSLINGGFFDASNLGLVIAMAFAFGGTAQLIAGIMEFNKNNTFGFTAFISYGAFWWSWALFVVFFKGETSGAFIGWYLAIWGTFTLMMFIGSLAKPKALQVIFFLLTITFYLLAYGDGTGNHAIVHIGGYFGLATALAAFYLAAAEMWHDCHGRFILPIGEKK